MHYHKHKMREKKKKKRRRSTSHWPCVPDVQSDEINTIGFIYIYSYIDIGDRKACTGSYFHVMFSLFVCIYMYSQFVVYTHTHTHHDQYWVNEK